MKLINNNNNFCDKEKSAGDVIKCNILYVLTHTCAFSRVSNKLHQTLITLFSRSSETCDRLHCSITEFDRIQFESKFASSIPIYSDAVKSRGIHP